jgi:hypothetical protein
MGITITKENLENIYKNYEAFKHKIKKNKSSPIRQKTNNINEILKENLIHDNKVKVNNIFKDDKNIINEYEVSKKEEDINKYLFRHNSSIGLKNSKELEEAIKLNDINYYETVSMDDNISEKSDYLDISNEPLFNRTKRSNNCDNKIIKANKLRNSYLTKLIYHKILTFQSEPKITNLIFFDWDDTLLCTSYLAPSGTIDEEDSKKIDKNAIKNLDQLSANLLSKSIKNGKVFIVTNAAHGWVEYSAKTLYPITARLLKDINIVSARGLYEKRFPGDYRQWKTKAFIDSVINCKIDRKKTTNIICFGDSIIELEATQQLKELFADGYIKTVKLKENPQPLELIKELTIILSQFDVILSNIRNLSIKVAKKKSE